MDEDGSSEESRQLSEIRRLLEQEVILLKEILHRLPPPPTFRPTVGIVVYPAAFDD